MPKNQMNHFKAFLFCMNKRHAQIKKSKMKLTNFPMKKRLSLALVCLICSIHDSMYMTWLPKCLTRTHNLMLFVFFL